MCEVLKVGEWIGWFGVYVHPFQITTCIWWKKKFNGFDVNKIIENIVQKNTLKSRDIKPIHMSPPTYSGGSSIVKCLDTGHSYKKSCPYLKYACYSCPYDFGKIFVNTNV